MASTGQSLMNGESDVYVDIDGHKVRNYDLRLSKIPRLDYREPQVESIIANEVSFAHLIWWAWALVAHDHELKNKHLKEICSCKKKKKELKDKKLHWLLSMVVSSLI